MRRALLPLLLVCAGCAIDQRLVLTVTDVPPEATRVELLVTRASDGADAREPLTFQPTRDASRMGNAFTVGLYLPRGGERYALSAAARDDRGCVLAAATLPFDGTGGAASLALAAFAPDGTNAALPRVCAPDAPAVRDLQADASADQYTLRGFGFRKTTRVLLAPLPDNPTSQGFSSCAPSAGACALSDGTALAPSAPEVLTRRDPLTLTLRTRLSSSSGAIGLCALVYDGDRFQTCAPVAANLLQFESTTLSFGAAVHPTSMAIADLDGDQRPDVALTSVLGTSGEDGGSVQWLKNQGGAFAVPGPAEAGRPAQTRTQAASLAGLAAADLDGDGAVDLASAAPAAGQVVVFRGSKVGPDLAQNALPFDAGPLPEVSAAADLNGDQRPDLLVVNDPLGLTVNLVTILVSQSGAPLTLKGSSYPVGLATSAIVAVPGPGLGRDLVTLGAGLVQGPSGPEGAGGYFYLKSRVAAVGQDQNLYDIIAKPLTPPFTVTDTLGGGLAAGDLDGDGVADVVVAGNVEVKTMAVARSVSVLRGSTPPAATPFAAPQRTPAGPAPFAAALGDLDGDGLTDIVVVNALKDQPATVTLLRNQGQGRFPAAALPSLPAGTDSASVGLADVDGDGLTDIVVASRGRTSKTATQATAGALYVFRNRTPKRAPLP